MARTLCPFLALAVLLALGLALVAQADKPDWRDALEKRTFTSDKGSLSYRLLKPEPYDAKQKYPLVVFLHGAGERGSDNTAQLKHGVFEFARPDGRKKHPCFLIAPQCPTGQSWGGLSLGKKGGDGKNQARLVLELIAQAQKDFPIDPDRIYLTGLSMGGYGTWGLLARRPDLFAAGIPICGGGDVKTADKLAKVPIWAFHGDKDKPVPVERSREMIAAIKKAGGDPKYTEYPGVGHDSWTQTYRDAKVLDWLFAQKRATKE